jgi:hypothetical protein
MMTNSTKEGGVYVPKKAFARPDAALAYKLGGCFRRVVRIIARSFE